MYQQLETIDELAKRWKCHKSWLYAKSRETGKDAMPKLKMGKYLRYVPSEVDEWLKKKNEGD